MKVAHVIASLTGLGAGPAYAATRFSCSLSESHVLGRVHTLMPVPRQSDVGCSVIGYRQSPVLRRLGISSDMRRGLGAIDADILHNHGVWMMPNVYAGTVARRRGLPLVFSPYGMFSQWAMAFSRRRKQVAWWCLGQRRAAAATTCFHATCESEAEDIRRLGFCQPIAVIPYGIDLPDPGSAEPPADRNGRRTMLFLSRVHPKKGLPILLRAWHRLEPRFPDWNLVVAGPDERGHLAEVQKLARELALERVSFPGPANGTDKQTLYRGADLFVLPTHSENFGIVVAEALASGVPVITTTGTPWQELERRGCGWWIELSERTLAEALEAAINLPDEQRRAMGRRGRLWMERSFGWPRIAAEMKSVYEWLLGGGPPPTSVLTD
jgi:glycosyltransferase involved in cell wall biosynthesis